MHRLCARPGCSEPATAVMSYDYAARTVWLDDPAGEAMPSAYELCAAHADTLSVPVGWARTDRRRSRRSAFRGAVAV